MTIGSRSSSYPVTFGAVFASGGWRMPFARAAKPLSAPLAKTLSFAAVHFAVAFAVVYALTGNVWLGGAVALIEPACNVVAYYLHEMAWARASEPRVPAFARR